MSDDGKPKWSRPADAVPRIWLKDGGIVIRDVTPDLDEYVVDHMVKKYISTHRNNFILNPVRCARW
jgi:hypothetical protein